MNKKPVQILVVLIAVVVVLNVGKNAITQSLFASTLTRVTHVPVKVGSVKVSFMKATIGIKDLRFFNPAGFQERLMLDAPQIYIDFEPRALLKGKAHFQEVRLDLKELVVVRNKEGRLNVDTLKPAAQKEEAERKEKAQKGEAPKLQIDKLYLTIGKVVYKDYSAGGEPMVQEFDIEIKDREFSNIDNPASIVSLILVEALTRTTLARLADLDVSVFKDTAMGTLSQGLGIAGNGAEQLESTAKNLLSIFK